MKLIAGLGNCCATYRNTRHNIGMEILATLAKKESFRDEIEAIAGEKIIFIPPEGYYNESGRYVSKAVRFYKANPEHDLLVVCDDFYLNFGELRLRLNGAHGGNNGLKSIIENFGMGDFARLRIGIDDGTKYRTDADKFVLDKFSKKEIEQIPKITEEVEERIREWLVLIKK